MSGSEAKAQVERLLLRELKVIVSYPKLRRLGFTGYTGFYLHEKKQATTLTTKAKLETAIQLAQFDFDHGTTIHEMVFDCCQHAPKKEFVEAIIGLDTATQKPTLMANLFDYHGKNGHNCLTICFDLAEKYEKVTNTFPQPTTGMMSEIDKTIRYLIKLGDDHYVYMDHVLNHATNSEKTLLSTARQYSKQLSGYLLNRSASQLEEAHTTGCRPHDFQTLLQLLVQVS